MLNSAIITFRDRGFRVLINAALNLLRANFCKYVLRKKLLTKRIYDYKMLLDLNDRGISRTLTLFGKRELDHKYILEKVLKPGMTVLDIGANIGYYLLMEQSLIGQKGKIIAVEPSPSNVVLLKNNIELNNYDGVIVIEGAVSDVITSRTLYLAEQSNLNTFHAVGSGIPYLSGETVEVMTYTVPDIAEKHGIPNIIRMDVEGHEVEVINGMLDAIREKSLRPIILFETHLTRYSSDHDMAASLRDLFQCGYKVRYLASSWQRGTKLINERGYKGTDPIATDGVTRVVYENIKDNDAIDFITRTGGARTVLLTPGMAS